MSLQMSEIPFGVRFLQVLTRKCCPRLRFNREKCFRFSVVFLTYIGYMCYHMSRKPISIVKSVLHRNCSEIRPAPHTDDPHWCEWAPFDGKNAPQMLGELDSAFLFSYAVAMFISGFVAERVNLRYFLSLGMLMSGIFCFLFGIGKTYGIHELYYYVIVQSLAGIFQTTGWPGVVTVMSNWFGKTKRGLIFGIWNSHTSIGNILGNVFGGIFVERDWAYSFIVPGLIIGIVGFIMFLFLVVNPSDVGLTTEQQRTVPGPSYSRLENPSVNDSPSVSDVDDSEIFVGEHEIQQREQRQSTEGSPLLASRNSSQRSETAIGFLKACKIPGVMEFSFCLFFSKLVNYTFMYWLPNYVNKNIKNPTLSADISALFDIGGIMGAIIAGVVNDKTEMPASTCLVMLALAAPVMFLYISLTTVSLGVNMLVLILVGILVNGPYALITTAVSAELGTHRSLQGNSKALATVTAIIDGTGSIGAAVGPLLAGFLQQYGWDYVFGMLIVSDLLALVLLLRLVKHEVCQMGLVRRGTRID